jgi:hypothetical protein
MGKNYIFFSGWGTGFGRSSEELTEDTEEIVMLSDAGLEFELEESEELESELDPLEELESCAPSWDFEDSEATFPG